MIKSTPKYRAFTLIELLVVISIIALLIAILLPALGAARKMARQLQSATQLRGIHQGMVIHANDNKGFYAGLNSKGQDIDSADLGNSGEGVTVEGRYWDLINNGYTTPDILISPAEVDQRESYQMGDPVTLRHYSYAMLVLNNSAGFPGGTGINIGPGATTDEWQDTGNSRAAMIADRNTADITGPGNVYSVWTQSFSGDWVGNVLWNDNHVTFENDARVEKTQYGKAPVAENDFLFGTGHATVGPFENAQMIKFGARTINDNGTSPQGAY